MVYWLLSIVLLLSFTEIITFLHGLFILILFRALSALKRIRVLLPTSVFFKYTFVFLQYSDIFQRVLTWTLYSNDCSNTTSFIWFDSLCSNVLDLHLKTQSKSWQYFLSYKVIFSTNNKTLWNFTIIWAGVWRVQCTCTGL